MTEIQCKERFLKRSDFLRSFYLLYTEVVGTFDQQPHTVDCDDTHTQQTDWSELDGERRTDSGKREREGKPGD